MSKIGDNPYPGTRAFTQADRAFFFGREAKAGAVVRDWTTNRLTVVSGPVASGKTSLLRAGVYPSMQVKPSRILPVGDFSQGMTFPFAALGEHNPFTLALLTSWSPQDVPARLAELSISDFVRRFARGEEGAVYASIDQMDDLVLGPQHGARAKWRQEFLAELTQAMRDHPRLHLLLVTRGEALRSFITRAVGGGARHEITGLTRQEAVAAVVEPAAAAGRRFTKEAADSLVDDLSAPGAAGSPDAGYVEPSLLQTVCRQLWDRLPPDVTEVSDWTIREYGDADAALATRCADVIGEVAALHDISSKGLRSWLVNHFVTDGGTRGIIHEGRPTTAGLPTAVPRGLLDRHLLTSESDESVRYYRLLTRRLVEPLWKAGVDRPAAPLAAGFQRAAERDLALGELDLAWAHADRALRAASGFRERAQAESLLGNVEYRRGQLGKALPRYRQAAELLRAAGDNAAATYQIAAAGRLLLAAGQFAEALPELRAAAERAPNDLGLQTQLALVLWQLGDGRGAVAILNAVLAANGGQLEARRARGEILADLGEARSAMLDLDRTAPGLPFTRAARGLALAELGDHKAAAEEISGAVADALRSGPVLLYAARVSDLAGDKDSAREWANDAINAVDPPLSPAHKQQAVKLAGTKPARTR